MRLFVAVPVPPASAFDAVAAEVRREVPRARVVDPAQHHVTLRFLGEVADPAPAMAALEAVPLAPQPVDVHGLGAFPGARRARVLWAGMEAPGLGALRDAVAAATAHLGQPEADRPFKPHVTLARLDPPEDVGPFVARHAGRRFWSGRLPEVVLFRSHLGPAGPRYEPLLRRALP